MAQADNDKHEVQLNLPASSKHTHGDAAANGDPELASAAAAAALAPPVIKVDAASLRQKDFKCSRRSG